MRARLAGGYRYKGRRDDRSVRPILALAGEGKTEALYAQYAVRASRSQYRMKAKSYKGMHGRQLVDEALRHAGQLKEQNPEALVVPAVLYDLEGSSGAAFIQAKSVVTYAQQNGVRIWISVPSIERWFVLHFSAFSHGRSPAVALKVLGDHLSKNRLAPYKKPGQPSFYTDLMLRTGAAVDQCQKSHTSDFSLPCICDFFAFLCEPIVA